MKEPEKFKLTQAEGEALIERIRANALTESDRGVLERLIHVYFWLLFTLQEAKLSLKRLTAPKKYTDRARAVLALGRYYLGLPFNRL